MTANVSLQGWDVANAVGLDVINAAITKQQTATPLTLAQPASGSLPKLAGAWNPWTMIRGGSDGTLRMSCPLATGSATFTVVVQLDPAKSNMTTIAISPDGLTASATATTVVSSAFGNAPETKGKFYFEATMNAAPTTGTVLVGVAPATSMVAGVQGNFARDPNAFGFNDNGRTETNQMTQGFLPGGGAGAGGAQGEVCKAGDIIGVAVDLDNGKIWFRGPSGAWQGAGADPATGAGAAYAIAPNAGMVPAVRVNANSAVTLNFGAKAFKFAAPAGFTSGWTGSGVVVLDGAAAEIEIQLAQVAVSATKTSFMADATGAGGNQAVTTLSVKPPAGATIPVARLREIQLALDDWFNANIASFNTVFHIADLDPALATGDLAWLKPVKANYAYKDSPTSGVFSILSITGDTTSPGSPPPHTPPATLSAQIDPNIIADMPAGANSVYAISAERFVSQILFQSAQKIMVGSTVNDFDYDPAALTISNNKKLTLGNVSLEDGTTVSPEVATGNLKISIIGNMIQVEKTEVTFSHPLVGLKGNEIITMNITQVFFLVLTKRTDGKHVLTVQNYDPALPAPTTPEMPNYTTFDINYSIDQDAKSFQNAMLWTAIGLSIFSLATSAFTAGAWILRSQKISNIVSNAAAQGNGVANLNNIALQPAGQVVLNGNIYQSASSALRDAVQYGILLPNAGPFPGITLAVMTRVAIGLTVLSVIGAVGAIGTGITYGLDQAQAFGDGDVNKLKAGLTFESMLKGMLEPFDWPGTNSWDLVDAQLRESLLVYGKLS